MDFNGACLTLIFVPICVFYYAVKLSKLSKLDKSVPNEDYLRLGNNKKDNYHYQSSTHAAQRAVLAHPKTDFMSLSTT